MKILVLNTGSSSVKYQLFSMPEEIVICSGLLERIGSGNTRIKHKSAKVNIDKSVQISNHEEALLFVVNILMDKVNGEIKSVEEIEAIGHRVVHGGHTYSSTVEINSEVKSKIKEWFDLAPLHNPSNLAGIEVAEAIFPQATQVAVFDTAFHQTIPIRAHKYAIPNKLYDENHIRVYGFHGTSHKYVTSMAEQYLNKDDTKIISIHLGNGCSITAVKNGESVDHSLGFAPVNGLIMGTRSGDLDHSLIFHLVNTLNYKLDDVQEMLQSSSGLIGLTGYSDLRDVVSEAEKGNPNCRLALDMKVYRIKKYIGSYIAAMNGLDCIILTAGIGENSELIREMVCSELDTFGILLDKEKNEALSNGVSEISADKSNVKILVIPTNEELEIARQTYELFLN